MGLGKRGVPARGVLIQKSFRNQIFVTICPLITELVMIRPIRSNGHQQWGIPEKNYKNYKMVVAHFYSDLIAKKIYKFPLKSKKVPTKTKTVLIKISGKSVTTWEF